MMSLAKKCETGVKSGMWHVSSYWKIYEMALWKGESCDDMYFLNTGKPVYNGHSRDWRYLSVIDRCPLKPGYHYYAPLNRFEYMYGVSK